MRVDRGLDLGRVHVGAAGNDHVGATVDEIEVAIGVDVAEVADGLPAVAIL
jgi:hypothetical protein